MTKLKTLLIGLGQIGALYDLDAVTKGLPLTHLSAILENETYDIAGFVEPESAVRERVKKATGLSSDIFHAVLPKDQFDVVVLACPPEHRLKQVEQIIDCAPQAIVFEKPLALTISEAHHIKHLCEAHNIKAVVNFHRRYDPDHQAFKAQLPDQPPYKIIFHYTKGLWNYGSHGIDLIQNWFSSVKEVVNKEKLILDDGTQVHLIAHDDGQYDMFDFEFFYEEAKYSLSDGGICKKKQTLEVDRYHKGYNHLDEAQDMMTPNKVYGLNMLYQDIAKACADSGYSLQGCSLGEAISGIEILKQLSRNANND